MTEFAVVMLGVSCTLLAGITFYLTASIKALEERVASIEKFLVL